MSTTSRVAIVKLSLLFIIFSLGTSVVNDLLLSLFGPPVEAAAQPTAYSGRFGFVVAGVALFSVWRARPLDVTLLLLGIVAAVFGAMLNRNVALELGAALCALSGGLRLAMFLVGDGSDARVAAIFSRRRPDTGVSA